ncbi:hypothetical protein IPF89_03180 [Candidatus Saccharibacteria bacterium]|uniref:hypothetical protein n=1 Tax=Candidatus Saccharimonas aalborgensis TaxID=1332188 RepID=UPI00059D79AE|nr:hypothetical protein [Candidatus Saccharimonas aalborgensis]QQR50772.1 MAG: hypothetical protein IPF89_03180 [Candidatus Saccharibacteria bacterium]QQS68517.1 MAG: hypothetical protein IPP24_00545 [Candidatus Saccharibacteria bacterium]QQS70811.1 MAG: hypothetical protein IPP92_00690 [Candidatus Saccharibacteria bacterium]
MNNATRQHYFRALLAALNAGDERYWATKAEAFVVELAKGDKALADFVAAVKAATPPGSNTYFATFSALIHQVANTGDLGRGIALGRQIAGISASTNPYDPQPKGPGVVGAFKDSYHKGRDKARSRAVRPTAPAAGTRRRVGL